MGFPYVLFFFSFYSCLCPPRIPAQALNIAQHVSIINLKHPLVGKVPYLRSHRNAHANPYYLPRWLWIIGLPVNRGKDGQVLLSTCLAWRFYKVASTTRHSADLVLRVQIIIYLLITCVDDFFDNSSFWYSSVLSISKADCFFLPDGGLLCVMNVKSL